MPLLGFLSATLYWPGLPSEALAPRWAALAIGIPLVSRLDLRLMPPHLLWLWGTGLMFAAASLAWSLDPLGGALDLYRLALIGLVMLAALQSGSIDATLAGLGWGTAVSSVLCVPQMLGWSPVEQAAPPAGLFINRDILAEAAAPLSVWAYSKRRWMLAAVTAVPLLVCGSRVALLATGIGVFAVSTVKIRLSAYALVLLLLVAFIVSLDPSKAATAWARIEIWRAAISLAAPFGAGMGSFAAVYPGYEYAHSDLLQLIVELGMGAVPFIALVLVLARSSLRADPGIRAAGTALAAEAIISFPLHLPTTAFLAGVVAAGLVRPWPLVRRDESLGSDPNGEPLWADPLAIAARYRFRESGEDLPVRSASEGDPRQPEKFAMGVTE